MKIDAFLQTLPIMGYGMLGIFVVIGVIYLAILIISRVTMKTSPEEPKQS